MEIISSIIDNEFSRNGYSKGDIIQGLQLFLSVNSTDYWIVSYGFFDINKQVELFKEVQKLSSRYNFIEKNISMLIIIDAEKNKDILPHIIPIENDKAFFKKYVLSFHPTAAERLFSVMKDKNVQSISELLMNNDLFTNVRSSSDASTSEYLLYALAHKLPFVPVNPNHKERTIVNLSFENPDLTEDLNWVNDAPTSENELQNYINSLLSDINHEAVDN